MANINEFQAALRNGIRLNRYKVTINTPGGVFGDTQLLSLMVRAANVPAMETGIVEVLYKGELIKLSGDERAAGEWAVTGALNAGTSPAAFKQMADQWQALAAQSSDPAAYKADAKIEMLSPDTDESVLLTWEVTGLWLANSGEINFADDTTDEVATMDLSFQYDRVDAV